MYDQSEWIKTTNGLKNNWLVEITWLEFLKHKALMYKEVKGIVFEEVSVIFKLYFIFSKSNVIILYSILQYVI